MPIIQQINNDDLKHPGDDPNVTDPQENEKEGNVFGKVFDAIFGDFEGKNSISKNEADPKPDPAKAAELNAEHIEVKPSEEEDIIDDEEQGGSL